MVCARHGLACAGISILAGFVWAAPAIGATLMGSTRGDAPALSPDKMYRVSLNPAPMTADMAPTAAELRLIQRIYVSYNISAAPAPAASPGTFNVLQYHPFALNTLGGADLTVLYDDGVAAPRTDYNWVQFYDAVNWGPANRASSNGLGVDSLVRGSPFYGSYSPNNLPNLMTRRGNYANDGNIWNDTTAYPSKSIQNPTAGPNTPAGDLFLQDEPFCSYTCLVGDKPSSITYDTFLVTFTAPVFGRNGRVTQKGTVTIFDGFNWGVQIAKVPEPGTWMLLLTGLGAIGAQLRRRSATVAVATPRQGAHGGSSPSWERDHAPDHPRNRWQSIGDVARNGSDLPV